MSATLNSGAITKPLCTRSSCIGPCDCGGCASSASCADASEAEQTRSAANANDADVLVLIADLLLPHRRQAHVERHGVAAPHLDLRRVALVAVLANLDAVRTLGEL